MKRGISVILSSILIILSFVGCGGKNSEMALGGTSNQTVAITVNTQEITPLTIEQSTSVSSKITAENEVSVYPSSGGTVKEVYVSLGDTVKAGDVLFEIDSTDAQLQLQQGLLVLREGQGGHGVLPQVRPGLLRGASFPAAARQQQGGGQGQTDELFHGVFLSFYCIQALPSTTSPW